MTDLSTQSFTPFLFLNLFPTSLRSITEKRALKLYSSPCALFQKSFFYLLIFCLILVGLGFHCWMWTFSSCGKWASRRGGCSWCRAQAAGYEAFKVSRRLYLVGTQAQYLWVHGLSYPAACGIFPDQGSNCVPCIGRWILNPWITRSPRFCFLNAVVWKECLILSLFTGKHQVPGKPQG